MEPAAFRIEVNIPELASTLVASDCRLPVFAQWPLEDGCVLQDQPGTLGSTFLGTAASEDQARLLQDAVGGVTGARFGRVMVRFTISAAAGSIPEEIQGWAWVPIDAAIRHVQELVRMYVPEGVSLSEELMVERRSRSD